MQKKSFSLLTLLLLLSQLAVTRAVTPSNPPNFRSLTSLPNRSIPKNWISQAATPTSHSSPGNTSSDSSSLPSSSENVANKLPVIEPLLPTPPGWLDPKKNNALPTELECDIARLLVLEDTPTVAADGSTSSAVIANIYASLLSLFATDEASQEIMYTDAIRPYIKQEKDPNGSYFYTAVPGEENRLLGYSHCLSATKFRDVLCKDQDNYFTLDANVDSNQQTYFWVHFTTLFVSPEDGSENASSHYQWISSATGFGNYYDFYMTKDHPPDSSTYFQNGSNLCVRSFTGSIWIGSKDNSNLTNNDWTVTGNKFIGLSTSRNGDPFIKDPDSFPPKQDVPSEQPPSNAPSASEEHAGCAWDDYELQLANPNSHFKGSAWDQYSQQISHNTQSPSSNQSKNNSPQQAPPLDKETQEKIKLAIKLYQEGNSLEQIEGATGFSEAELKVIFSKLTQ